MLVVVAADYLSGCPVDPFVGPGVLHADGLTASAALVAVHRGYFDYAVSGVEESHEWVCEIHAIYCVVYVLKC